MQQLKLRGYKPVYTLEKSLKKANPNLYDLAKNNGLDTIFDLEDVEGLAQAGFTFGDDDCERLRVFAIRAKTSSRGEEHTTEKDMLIEMDITLFDKLMKPLKAKQTFDLGRIFEKRFHKGKFVR